MSSTRLGSLDTYPDDIVRLRATLPAIAAELANFTGVGQVLDWMNTRGQPVVDLVGMDEFEYDFLVELKPEGCWLAFGVT